MTATTADLARGLGTVKQALESKQRDPQNLVSARLDDEAVSALATGLASNTSIALLKLCVNALSEKGLAAIGAALKSNTGLRELDLSMTKMGDAELRALLPGLKANRGLRRLRLRHNTFSDEAARELLAAFEEHATLVWCVPNNCRVSSSLVGTFSSTTTARIRDALAAELKRVSSASTAVADFSALAADAEAVAAVAKCLVDSKIVTRLDLAFCPGLQDEALAPLLELLKSNTALREIRLDGNTGLSEGCRQQVEAALQKNRGEPAADRGDSKQQAAAPEAKA